jgi:hypothetical protein
MASRCADNRGPPGRLPIPVGRTARNRDPSRPGPCQPRHAAHSPLSESLSLSSLPMIAGGRFLRFFARPQSRRSHGAVTAQSQRSHGAVAAQSRSSGRLCCGAGEARFAARPAAGPGGSDGRTNPLRQRRWRLGVGPHPHAHRRAVGTVAPGRASGTIRARGPGPWAGVVAQQSGSPPSLLQHPSRKFRPIKMARRSRRPPRDSASLLYHCTVTNGVPQLQRLGRMQRSPPFQAE